MSASFPIVVHNGLASLPFGVCYIFFHSKYNLWDTKAKENKMPTLLRTVLIFGSNPPKNPWHSGYDENRVREKSCVCSKHDDQMLANSGNARQNFKHIMSIGAA